VLLKAFASGSSALTGVESIANGVNASAAAVRNAGQTLVILGCIAITAFLGVSYLHTSRTRGEQHRLGALQIAVPSFPARAPASLYYLLQAFTFAILVFAATSSRASGSRRCARDRYFPRQFVNLGDRLVSRTDLRAQRDRYRADHPLQGERQLADPPLRRRRVYRLHARRPAWFATGSATAAVAGKPAPR
jgi:hypothetical protein